MRPLAVVVSLLVSLLDGSSASVGDTFLNIVRRHEQLSLAAAGSSLGAGASAAGGAQYRTRASQVRANGGWAKEELEGYVDGHSAVQCSLGEEAVSSIVGRITPQAYQEELASFVGMAETRYIARPGNVKTGEFVKSKLAQLGYQVDTEEVTFNGEVMPEGNIVALKLGTQPEEFVILGAHYDSVNWEDLGGAAPGAEDNGSGVAALLQAAANIASVNTTRSVVFIGFNGEEVGTLGSQAFVKELQKPGGRFAKFGTLKQVIILDEVAYASSAENRNHAILETKGKNDANTALVDTVAASLSAEGSVVKGFEVNYHGFGSDHIAFLDAGYPALLLIERDNLDYSTKFGHSDRDVLANADPAFGAAMARIATRALLAVAAPAA